MSEFEGKLGLLFRKRPEDRTRETSMTSAAIRAIFFIYIFSFHDPIQCFADGVPESTCVFQTFIYQKREFPFLTSPSVS
jgi:hypothetical protein